MADVAIGTAGVALAFLAVSIGLFVWWLMILIEAVRIPDDRWQIAGQSKLVHILLMVFLGVLGTVIYVMTARRALQASWEGPSTR